VAHEDAKAVRTASEPVLGRTAPRPRWRKPHMVAYDVEAVTETRVCGHGSDSFPGWCATAS